MKKIMLILFTLLIIFSCSTEESALSEDISGSLRDGLRYLDIAEIEKNNEISAYRGDYIVIELPEGQELRFIVEALSIDTLFPRPEGQSSYVKLKESGEFPYRLGEEEGTLRVKDLQSPLYVEVTAAEAVELIETAEPFILDVRTPSEYEAQHLVGSYLLPVQVLEEEMDQLESYKDEVVLVYCRSGNRSTVASQMLLEAGFTRVYNLRYGIGDWVSKGFPVE